MMPMLACLLVTIHDPLLVVEIVFILAYSFPNMYMPISNQHQFLPELIGVYIPS
jgi:hypothetical protein